MASTDREACRAALVTVVWFLVIGMVPFSMLSIYLANKGYNTTYESSKIPMANGNPDTGNWVVLGTMYCVGVAMAVLMRRPPAMFRRFFDSVGLMAGVLAVGSMAVNGELVVMASVAVAGGLAVIAMLIDLAAIVYNSHGWDVAVQQVASQGGCFPKRSNPLPAASPPPQLHPETLHQALYIDDDGVSREEKDVMA